VRVLGEPRVLRGVLRPLLAQLEQLLEDSALAALLPTADHGCAVALAVVAVPVIEAGVPRPGAHRGLGVHLLQVAQDEVHRLVQAVEVEAVEADRVDGVLVVRAQPHGEGLDDLVAPHPAREAQEVAQRVGRRAVLARPAHEAVDAVGRRPVGLDGHGVEAGLHDQPAGHAGALDVELVRPVRCLADQHAAPGADAIEQRVVVVGCAGDGNGRVERCADADCAHAPCL
jgi:hypothetical protein